MNRQKKSSSIGNLFKFKYSTKVALDTKVIPPSCFFIKAFFLKVVMKVRQRPASSIELENERMERWKSRYESEIFENVT